ncbi:MAG: DsbA family protein, partial [Proteobacteria bacterium]|nr:DsbA family protein [Pseudomonadota bacterium]
GDSAVLAEIAAACGDKRDEVLAWLDGNADTDKVQRMADGIRRQGINGVPFFILNRKLAVSGAQTTAVLGAAILQSLETGKPS